MAYETYEKALIESFGQDVKNGKIKPENTDLQGNAKVKYDRYIKTVKDIKPKTYLTTEFSNIGKKDVFETAFKIIISIFGEKAVPHAIEFFQHLIPSGAKEALDGISLTIIDKRDGSEVKAIEVPDFETTSNIVTIVHEFAHYYLKQINLDFNQKRYYEEIISILCEKIAGLIIDVNTSEKDFYNKITEQRLDSLSWHYGENLPMLQNILNEHAQMQRLAKKDLFAMIQLQSFEQQMPFLKTAQGISVLKGYYQNMADSYGMGFLYSESLLARYEDDHRTFRLQFEKLLSQELSLQQLLEYYGITAKSNSVYETVYKRLDEIKEFKKR